ncbi:HAMP domain-containing sensor histidine kinase [Lysinibacillus louembei]|uniref:histidine kinase n=1 Tax=Lysinibacillus louembei TaxID=1470088 RepID=A0ABZ0S1H1_9BACI|nr:HAMP domain-containing sensor histidine kinase [Lysinibacillus louembei]WPK13321.1 HAMP domain-containing sensor histidine kinase [Lysinibacillus louembei]
MKKLFNSLQAKYMLIIFTAIGLLWGIQITYSAVGIYWMNKNYDDETVDYTEVEKEWHEGANALEQASREQIQQYFAQWQAYLPQATMFWVDANGQLVEQMNVIEQIPAKWDAVTTAQYIKSHYGEDPFTVLAFLGQDAANGFVVIEIPREVFKVPMQKLHDRYGTLLMVSVLVGLLLFIVVSFLFFKGIRKRLMQLQEGMALRDMDGLPLQIEVKKKDEIGQLEQSFNQMVVELKESKQREQQEEQLRRELISNLSHDLRTPLTKVRAQAYSISKENLSVEGKQAVKALENSFVHIDHLMENLMSYTLLMASRFNYQPQEIDVVRFTREHLATWYPAFEKEGFTIDIELRAFTESKWLVDKIWLGRILDNLLQNVLRHAKDGRYIQVKTVETEQYQAIVLTDRGKGMQHLSDEKGAGIGLSIVDMMVKGMSLEWTIDTNEDGTMIQIKALKGYK